MFVEFGHITKGWFSIENSTWIASHCGTGEQVHKLAFRVFLGRINHRANMVTLSIPLNRMIIDRVMANRGNPRRSNSNQRKIVECNRVDRTSDSKGKTSMASQGMYLSFNLLRP